MDFNQAFTAYDSIEGTNCLTSLNQMTQKEAAIEAVKKYEMFLKRLSTLKEVI